MSGTTIDIDEVYRSDWLADHIADQYVEWQGFRNSWMGEKSELVSYVYATDTTQTTNAQLPWKNKTTLPKLAQIVDNLHANYLAALFPNEDWLDWHGNSEKDEQKREKILDYMKHKLRQMNFTDKISELLYDYILYGNVFPSVDFVSDYYENDLGDVVTSYSGPLLVRHSPYDLVFNPTAHSFEAAPKIVRVLYSVGELAQRMEQNPDNGFLDEALDALLARRNGMNNISQSDHIKGRHTQIDGFGDIRHYYGSQYVEILEFHGDYYNVETGELKRNRLVTIADRKQILRDIANPSWTGKSRIKHGGWRKRPDSLYAMGPLDNLVGMQYRMDHLENMRADAFDMIGYPMLKIKGVVEDFEYGPNERIYVGEEGDVTFLNPETDILQADTQINTLEARMEEMAGAPKQAMGIRTPGEKTKFEVQTLENAAGRIFQTKIAHFERTVIEPILNDMLEAARRNMDGSESVRVLDDEFGVAVFRTITKDDLTVKGRLYPKGARHFARKANMLQNLVTFSNSPLAQDGAVASHISGLRMARLLEELLELDKFDLVEENIRVAEEVDRQRMISSGEQILDQEGALPNEIPVDVPPEGGS